MITTTGISFSMHNCGCKIVRVSISPEYQSCCTEGEVNCCKIITEKIQLVENYLISQSNNQFEDISKDLQFENQNLFKEAYEFTFFAHTQLYNNHKSPPHFRSQVILASFQSYLL